MAFSFLQILTAPCKRRLRGRCRIIVYFLALLYVSILIVSMQTVDDLTSSSPILDSNGLNTLALLYPPGMIGGFRNQVYRFVSLVRHAKRYQQSQLLLPSILFSTTYKGQSSNQFYPIPFSEIFDVEHWNQFYPELPKLVNSLESSDCWMEDDTNALAIDESFLQKLSTIYDAKVIRILPINNTALVTPMMEILLKESILLTPVNQLTRAILTGRVQVLKPRKIDLYPLVKQCQQPFVYGGGRLGGKLWNEYVHMPKVNPSLSTENSVQAIENSKFISLVSQALLPNSKWRTVAQECILNHQGTPPFSSNKNKMAPYLALHTRVETDMLEHTCGKNMEKNLTKIFGMVESMVTHYNSEHDDAKVEGIVLAVSRYGMQRKPRNPLIQNMLDANWRTLQEHTRGGDVLECGEIWMDQWYSSQGSVIDDYYGSLIPMVLNYYIATHATIFVGVAKSSWSTDVWTARYHLGKGDTNLQYTPNGIVPVSNGGLPLAHTGCND